jgi:hypothetical protein
VVRKISRNRAQRIPRTRNVSLGDALSWARVGPLLTAVGAKLFSKVLRHAVLLSLSTCFLCLFVEPCLAADVVLIHGKSAHPAEEEAILKLADFYGLKLYNIDISSPNANHQLISRLSGDTLAVLASQDALAVLDRRRIQTALRRPRGSGVPMLVFGVTAGENTSDLKSWSGGRIQACRSLANDYRPKVLAVANGGELTRTLSGLELPAVASPACRMQFDPAPTLQALLIARGDGLADTAVLVHSRTQTTETFFIPQMDSFDQSWRGDALGLPRAFSSAAPFILFLSYAAGDYGWHLDGHYANLTIDDAWLTRMYGHLAYAGLLVEMERHNFHTTIAFIPWNFDRSKTDVVALFLAHPDRFSVCIHGNDHDHQEFGDYSINSLKRQIADIKQGVARMERFHTLTGIPYDRFMVFPHGVAPEATFAELRKYEFLGTANSSNVPTGAKAASDSVFLLRPYTATYAHFLSFLRYPATAAIPRLEIAIHSFLGNPLLFYGHESLFDNGINAFDPFADHVNEIQPDTEWTSLGEIARHSHLIRRRSDSEFEVLMLSSEAELKNPTSRDAVFYVRREEDPSQVIRSFTVDGTDSAFVRSGNTVTLRLVIPAGRVRRLRIAYQNDLDLSRENIRRRNDLRAYSLRLTSDFRDLYLSRFSLGRSIRRAYYGRGWDSIELRLEHDWWIGAVIIVLAWAGLRFRRQKARKRDFAKRSSIANHRR